MFVPFMGLMCRQTGPWITGVIASVTSQQCWCVVLFVDGSVAVYHGAAAIWDPTGADSFH